MDHEKKKKNSVKIHKFSKCSPPPQVDKNTEPLIERTEDTMNNVPGVVRWRIAPPVPEGDALMPFAPEPNSPLSSAQSCSAPPWHWRPHQYLSRSPPASSGQSPGCSPEARTVLSGPAVKKKERKKSRVRCGLEFPKNVQISDRGGNYTLLASLARASRPFSSLL